MKTSRLDAADLWNTSRERFAETRSSEEAGKAEKMHEIAESPLFFVKELRNNENICWIIN